MSNPSPVPEAHPAAGGISVCGRSAWRKRLLNGALIGVPLVGTAYACAYFLTHPPGWVEWVCFLAFYLVVGIGVGVGFHRCFTHRSFVPAAPLKFTLLLAGSLAFQGSVVRWVADHRRHHRYTDRAWDTPSPYWYRERPIRGRLAGLFHAHIGWMFDRTTTHYEVYAPDLLKDRMVMAFHRAYPMLCGLSLLLPWGFGWVLGGPAIGIGCFLFGGCVRACVFHHVVWGVNSVGHMFGGRESSVRDQSRNNALLAALTFGEGWHNNHHAAPRVAFNRWRWHEWDVNGLLIRFLGWLRLVSEIVDPEQYQGAKATPSSKVDPG